MKDRMGGQLALPASSVICTTEPFGACPLGDSGLVWKQAFSTEHVIVNKLPILNKLSTGSSDLHGRYTYTSATATTLKTGNCSVVTSSVMQKILSVFACCCISLLQLNPTCAI